VVGGTGRITGVLGVFEKTDLPVSGRSKIGTVVRIKGEDGAARTREAAGVTGRTNCVGGIFPNELAFSLKIANEVERGNKNKKTNGKKQDKCAGKSLCPEIQSLERGRAACL